MVEAINDARPERFDEHVGRGREREQPVAIARLFQIQHDAFLAAVQTAEEHRARPVGEPDPALQPDFRSGRFHTQWLDDWLASPRLIAREATAEETFLAALSLTEAAGRALPQPARDRSRWMETARAAALRSGEGRLRR